MAEEDGKKEEKFDFTREGEAVSYIGVDQARVMAIRHARDNTDFYGPGYSGVALVWEVISEEQSEDYYDIRLSFRPAGLTHRNLGSYNPGQGQAARAVRRIRARGGVPGCIKEPDGRERGQQRG